MKINLLTLLFLLIIGFKSIVAQNNNVIFHPIEHATLVIEYEGQFIYVDPAVEPEAFKDFPNPVIILITHTHPDHFNPETINKIKIGNTIVIGNKSSIDQLGAGIYLLNGEKKSVGLVEIDAVPMYNLTSSRKHYHPKDDGNGYVITLGNERIYISGDTEDIPEMRALKNIDHAFICMNLPFTMTPEQAASAVIEFKPKKIYPYHFNRKEYPENILTFKELVSKGCDSKVIVLDWKETQN